MQMYQRKNRRFIQVEGQDAEKFLQNLLSQNLSLLQQTPDQAVLSCLLNQKGGVEAYFWVSLDQDGFVLDMHKDMLETVLGIFQSYKLRTKVDFHLLPIQYSYYTTEKSNVGLKVQQHAIHVHEQQLYRAVILDNHENESFEGAIWDEYAWELFRIQQQWPKWQQDVEPGMLVLQSDFLKQGIALDKGCYLGQETVARVHARGERVARKLVQIKAAINSLQIGQSLHKLNEEKAVGNITSVGQNKKMQEDWALALVHREALQEQRLISNKSIEIEVIHE